MTAQLSAGREALAEVLAETEGRVGRLLFSADLDGVPTEELLRLLDSSGLRWSERLQFEKE
jgi:hypothetical protein